ncbi:MAG: hypothetical protein WC997_14250 [Porticoccaceae bacterium]
MKTYRAIKAFPHGNSYVASGAIVRLTDKQATFLTTGGYVEPHDEVDNAPVVHAQEDAGQAAPKAVTGKGASKAAEGGK